MCPVFWVHIKRGGTFFVGGETADAVSLCRRTGSSALSQYSVDDLTVDTDPAAVGAAGIETAGAGFAFVQIGTVLQGEQIGIDAVPQFMAQGRAEIPYDKGVACLVISAATVAFGDGKLDFCHRSVLLNLYGDEIANLIQKPHADAIHGRKLLR